MSALRAAPTLHRYERDYRHHCVRRGVALHSARVAATPQVESESRHLVDRPRRRGRARIGVTLAARVLRHGLASCNRRLSRRRSHHTAARSARDPGRIRPVTSSVLTAPGGRQCQSTVTVPIWVALALRSLSRVQSRVPGDRSMEPSRWASTGLRPCPVGRECRRGGEARHGSETGSWRVGQAI